MRRNDQFSDSQKVYQMCTPHPKPLLQGRRSLVRHGTLDYFSPNTISRKPRYFFLFSDCLLLTKRTGTQKFWLKIYIHLGPNIHIIPMWDSPDFEFRLLIDEKGTLAKRKQRRLILYGQNKSHKEAWLNDLLHCLWDSTGRKGADPSIRDDKKELKSPRGKKEEGDKWSCSNCTYLNKPGTSHCDMCGGAKFGGDVEEYDSSDDEEKRKRRENKHKKDRQQGGGQHADNYSDNSNPLLLFDPFSDPKGPDASFDPSQHRGIDQYGQAVPKGVMLEGDNPYGSGAGPYGAGGGYGTGAPGPYGSGAGGYDPSQGAYGAGGAYGSGASPYGAGAESAGLAGTAYAGGASPYGYGGVAASPYGYGTDPSGLYDAARNASSALGGMFATAPGSGGAAGGAGLAGAGLGGAGGFGAGVATTSPPHSSGSGGSPASSQRDDNLDDLAQKELLEATRVIEQLAAQLASRPRKAPPRTAETEHLEITTEEISDAILDGAQAIARAASALMRAASLAQEERVKLNTQRASGDATYHADPVWANGLISAARNVVATTQYLVSTANSASNGQAGEETLVASARAVGAATAHLVAAQKAKGDVNSQASRELDDAARGIARATASLVEAAKLASTPAPAPAPAAAAVPDKYTMTDKQIREIEAQTRLLQLEKETQRAREELLKMRKQEYSG